MRLAGLLGYVNFLLLSVAFSRFLNIFTRGNNFYGLCNCRLSFLLFRFPLTSTTSLFREHLKRIIQNLAVVLRNLGLFIILVGESILGEMLLSDWFGVFAVKKCACSSFVHFAISSMFAGSGANLIVKISLEFRAWRMEEGAIGVDTTNWLLNPTTLFPINSYETTTFPNTLLLNNRFSSFNTLTPNPG